MAKKKTIGQLKKELDRHFNKYIRLRDTEDRYGPCISCGFVFPFEELDAGHFFAKNGYDGIRFDECNVNAECRKCNRFDDSHLIGYHDNLTKKIGEEGMIDLKERAAEYKRGSFKWSRIELEEMIVYYKQKVKEMS